MKLFGKPPHQLLTAAYFVAYIMIIIDNSIKGKQSNTGYINILNRRVTCIVRIIVGT